MNVEESYFCLPEAIYALRGDLCTEFPVSVISDDFKKKDDSYYQLVIDDINFLFSGEEEYESEKILPVITSKFDLEIYDTKDTSSWIYSKIDYSEEFVIQYCTPSAIVMRFLTKKFRKEDAIKIHETSLINIRKVIEKSKKDNKLIFESRGDDVFCSNWNNDSDTALISIKEELLTLNIPENKMIIFMPNRSTLIICNSSEKSLYKASSISLNILEASGYSHTPAYPLNWNNGKLAPYIPEKYETAYEIIKQIYYSWFLWKSGG